MVAADLRAAATSFEFPRWVRVIACEQAPTAWFYLGACFVIPYSYVLDVGLSLATRRVGG